MRNALRSVCVSQFFIKSILAFFGMFSFGIATFFALFFVGFFAKLTFKLPEFKIIANIVIIINITMLFKMFLQKIL